MQIASFIFLYFDQILIELSILANWQKRNWLLFYLEEFSKIRFQANHKLLKMSNILKISKPKSKSILIMFVLILEQYTVIFTSIKWFISAQLY